MYTHIKKLSMSYKKMKPPVSVPFVIIVLLKIEDYTYIP